MQKKPPRYLLAMTFGPRAQCHPPKFTAYRSPEVRATQARPLVELLSAEGPMDVFPNLSFWSPGFSHA
jgi:hypothetical protein